jgi:hypothetical protein
MAYIIQFDVPAQKAEAMLDDNLHVISLQSDSLPSRDEVLASFFQAIQEALDFKSGMSLRISRPDIFEELRADVIQEAIPSEDLSAIAEATSQLCFVLMPFGEKFDALYRTEIAPAVSAQGFTALRADELSGPGFVMEQIRSAIQHARFCIADLTMSNPNVLYEMGLAQAANKPMILLAEKGANIPFDLSHHRIIFYEFTPGGMNALAGPLRDAINSVAAQDRIPEAARLFDMGIFRSSIASSAIALEQRLKSMLTERSPGGALPTKSLRYMLKVLYGMKRITSAQLSELTEVVALRNKAIHEPKMPTKAEAEFVLRAVRSFLEQSQVSEDG